MNPYIHLGLFITYLVAEILYVHFVIYVNDRSAILAALCSAAIPAVLLLGITQCSNNILYLVPCCLGAFVGTYVTVKRKEKPYVKSIATNPSYPFGY